MRKERRSRYTLRVLATVSLVALIVGGLATRGSALHRQTPVFLQVTENASDVGRIAAWTPQFFAFEACGDVAGTCSVGCQIFIFDLRLRVLGGASGIKQITFGPFNPSGPSIARENGVSIPGNLAFEADGGFCSHPANRCVNPQPTTGRQIFVYRPVTNDTLQVTAGPGDMLAPDIAGRGRHVVFHTTTDLLGSGAIGTVPEVYLGDLTRIVPPNCTHLPCAGVAPNRGLQRISFGGGQNGVVNFNRKKVAFESSGDNLNGGANPGVQQIYLYDVRDEVLSQVTTDPALPARKPNISHSGRVVSYEQDRNSGGGVVTQVFVATFRKRGTIITQVSKGALSSTDPSLSSDGRRVAFVSASDLLLQGTPPNQVYIYDIRRNTLIQVTGGPNGGDMPEATRAVIMGFNSSDDLTGNGNSTRQFFVSNFFRHAPFNLPTTFPGTPTPGPSPTATPHAGIPNDIALALLTDEGVSNGDNTLTTVVAATVLDFYGNPVPDGTFVDFNVVQPTNGVLIGDGSTNTDPTCNVSQFEIETGTPVINQPGVAHVCVTYPFNQVFTQRIISAVAGGPAPTPSGANPLPSPTPVTDTETITLPPPVNQCEFSGTTCSDHNLCTTGDICAGGNSQRGCVGGTNAGAPCTVASHCPAGQCVLVNPPYCTPGGPVTCQDDGNPCTVDTCQEFAGCNATINCLDDGNPCLDDVCDVTSGLCGVPNTDPCDDGDPCTDNDVCGAGACAGTARVCADDFNPCTQDTCDPQNGLCGIPIEPCVCPTAVSTTVPTPGPTSTP